MTFTALSIITIILSLAAVVATFVPRIPSVAAAYAALVCAHLAGAIYVDAKILIFWGVASAIVLGLRVLQPKALVMTAKGLPYVALATIAGTAIGYMISPTMRFRRSRTRCHRIYADTGSPEHRHCILTIC